MNRLRTRRTSSVIALLAVLLAAQGCDQSGIFGTEFDNRPPTTRLTVGEVDLPEGTLLSSRIALSWWGSDPDGYILGYEVAVNDTTPGAWTFTRSTDSLFTLPIRPGLESDEVLVRVRAVDDDSLRDPVGASVRLPVRNTVPSVAFTPAQRPPDSTFSVASMGWTVADQDGLVSLSAVQIAFNDTLAPDAWTSLPLPPAEDEGRMFITLLIQPAQPGDPAAADVLYGTSLSTLPQPVSVGNLRLQERNTAYLRAIDNSGAVSPIDTLSWFIRRQASNVLLINDDDSPQSADRESFHLALLEENGITPDVLRVNDGDASGGAKVKLSTRFPANPATRERMLAAWDHIYWFSNNLDRNITYAQAMTGAFFEAGGTFFAAIPSKNLSPGDELFRFLPVGAIARPEGIQNSFRIRRNTEALGAEGSGLPPLKFPSNVLSVFPMQAVSGARVLYTVDFWVQWVTGQVFDYTGFEDLVIASGEGNLIYAALDLTTANGNRNMPEFISRICLDELGFQPDGARP